MGASRWNDVSYSHYNDTVTSRTHDPRIVRSGTAHTADIAEGRVARRVHQLLDPHGVIHRESRDSAANPNSLAIAVWFDVTGSMGGIPVVLQRKLKTLMTTLIDHHYATDPAVFFGAIGDATCDDGPLQVGQFESDIQMDEHMSRMWLEGGGGGQQTESYELAYYFTARHMVTDCWEKRQKKGYLFTIGDERPYDRVSREHIERIIGAAGQSVTTDTIIRECEQRWHVFHLLADTTTSRQFPNVVETWDELLGDHVIRMPDPNYCAEIIALTIGINEGRVTAGTARTALLGMGVDEATVEAITAAVTPITRGIVVHD